MKHWLWLFLFLTISITGLSLSLVRGPYLQMSGPNTVTIRWRTDSISASHVSYGFAPNALVNSFTSLFYHTEHVVTLTNLLPDTKYYYAIGSNWVILQSDSNQYFKTAPVVSASYDKPLRFWAVGDLSKQTPQQIHVRNAYLQHKDTAYVNGWILLGDNAYENGLDSEYQQGFFNYYQEDILKNTVLFPTIGNHDYANNTDRRKDHQIPYLNIFSFPTQGELGGIPSNSKRYYSFNYGNVHFVHLDSYGLDEVNGIFYALSDTLYSPQITWLKNDLEANNLPWVIVSFHHPPYCMGSHNSDDELDLVAIRTQVVPILEKYNVDLVLNGHSHSYERSFFTQKHYGMENTFDSTTHIKQPGSGAYDGTSLSCPYIKNNPQPSANDSGTIYSVVGSGSAIPQIPYAAWPHNAMYYSNIENNGSLLLTIEGNKLTGAWISTDTTQVIKDKFTLFKNVNTRHWLTAALGDTVTLTARWSANKYFWNTGDTTRQIQVLITGDTTFYVSDVYHCFTDTLQISTAVNTQETTVLDFQIFPNPAYQMIFIKCNTQEALSYDIMDMAGRRIIHSEIKNEPRSISLPSGLQPGVYLLKITAEKGQYAVRKFSVND